MKRIVFGVILSLIIAFINVILLVNLSLNNQYFVMEIKYAENRSQAKGIQDVISSDYNQLISYLLVQTILIILILGYFIIPHFKTTKVR